MAADYPAFFNVAKPERFDRSQMALRIVIMLVLSFFGVLGLIFSGLYLIFPVLAAIFISQKGAERFMEEDGERMTGWLRFVVAALAYLWLLTDRLPTEKPEESVTYRIDRGGSPTVGSALLRLIFSIPSAFVLGLLSIIGAILWIIAAVMVLVQEDYPEGIYNFNVGVLRWQARLLAYHASLVEPYPPFAVDTGPLDEGPAPGPAEQHAE